MRSKTQRSEERLENPWPDPEVDEQALGEYEAWLRTRPPLIGNPCPSCGALFEANHACARGSVPEDQIPF